MTFSPDQLEALEAEYQTSTKIRKDKAVALGLKINLTSNQVVLL